MIDKPSIAILAGGLATRLGPLVAHTPKALLELAGKPFLAWQLELLHRSGIEDVTLCLGHLAEPIISAARQHQPAGMRIQISCDGEVALGTGGALRHALPLLSDPFLVLYGDSYLRCDYLAIHRAFLAARSGSGSAAPLGLMTVFRNDDHFDASNVWYANGCIRAYNKQTKHPEMRHIDWGLGELTHAAFEPFSQRERFDLADLYATLVASGRLLGHEVEQRFFEIGSVAGLEELRAWLPAHGA